MDILSSDYYPPILLHVAPKVLEQRLLHRKRETAQQIQDRLARNRQFDYLGTQHIGNPVIMIDNSGPAKYAVTALCEILEHGVYNSDTLVLSTSHHT